MFEPEPDTIRRAQHGDADAFEEIVRAYLPDVHRWARHVVGDASAADDVAQDTFLNVFRALPRFRGRSKFSTWLFRITRNCAIEATRKRARQQRLEQEQTQHVQPDPALRFAVRAAIEALPDDLRDVFVTVEIFGFSYAEASTILSMPVGTIKSRMHRTRQLLIASLADEEDVQDGA